MAQATPLEFRDLPVIAVKPNELRSCGIGQDVTGIFTVTVKYVVESTTVTVSPVAWNPRGLRTLRTADRTLVFRSVEFAKTPAAVRAPSVAAELTA